ncbi:hypothetical protein [Neosynechococcus sphagnicola]|uniref:hypothetical protein n=1 Tax=Neosynechococcus sphagnicola TaxID=1501145 RepID=UPI00068FBA1A|nr:hypothetical protein [Neosynechococcus sphagnicola]
MNSPRRFSPVHEALRQLGGSWQEINGMPALIRGSQDQQTASHLGIADLSFLCRYGVKGTNAAPWLASHGISVPETPNTWGVLPGSGLIARLGMTEFLLEDGLDSSLTLQIRQVCQPPPCPGLPGAAAGFIPGPLWHRCAGIAAANLQS